MGKTLFVSDFDDTLAKTDANVFVTDASGERREMSPEDYAVYDAQPGDQFDFSEFEQLKNPRPIMRFVKLLKRAVEEGKADKVAILTARGHTKPIAKFLQLMGITSGVSIAALGSSDPQRKARYIEKHIADGYDRVAFIDDSPKNVAAVEELRKKYPHVKLVVHQVKGHADAPKTPSTTPPTSSTTTPTSAEDSEIAKQAAALGLDYFGFGRYGKKGVGQNDTNKVTHTSQNGRLVPKQKS